MRALKVDWTLVRGRRKVLLWSRSPWIDVDCCGSPALPPGRFIAGTTHTPSGAMRFVGICIPWRDAHVRSGRRDRTIWEDHLTYLEHLPAALYPLGELPVVVAGDFNQRIPRFRQPQHVFTALERTLLPELEIITAGAIEHAPGLSIDHVAIPASLERVTVDYIDPYTVDGRKMSDHFGVHTALRRRQAPGIPVM